MDPLDCAEMDCPHWRQEMCCWDGPCAILQDRAEKAEAEVDRLKGAIEALHKAHMMGRDSLKKALRGLWRAMQNGDPAWCESDDPRAVAARELLGNEIA